MSQIHRVILLNKPLKIFDFTVLQLLLMFGATVTALCVGTGIPWPKEWKILNVGAGFWVGFFIFCGSLALVKMSEVKPWAWWRNLVLYRLKMVPIEFLPHPEPAQLYPDPTIIDVKKRTSDIYVDAE